jgi:hypothetical protein
LSFFDLIIAISSGSVLAARSLRAMSTIGTSATWPMYSKSVMGLNASLRYSVVLVAMPLWCSSSV